MFDTMLWSWWKLATSTAEMMLLTTWLDCGKQVIWKISKAISRTSYGPYHSLELPNQRMKQGPILQWLKHNINQSLTHWGWVTHICISKLTIIGSPNDLLPGQCQAIIWTNAWIMLIGLLGINFSEIIMKNHIFSSKKLHLNVSSAKCWPFCHGTNVLNS